MSRNTEPKETTWSHKMACMLHSKTLRYGDILDLFLTIAQHSKPKDFEGAVLFHSDNIGKALRSRKRGFLTLFSGWTKKMCGNR